MAEKIQKVVYTHRNGTKEVFALHIDGETVPTVQSFMTQITGTRKYIDRVDTIAKVAIALSSVSIVISIVVLKLFILRS